jgi:hypothetical protein
LDGDFLRKITNIVLENGFRFVTHAEYVEALKNDNAGGTAK